MKKQYIDFAGIKSILRSLRTKLDKKFHAEAKRVDEMIAEDRSTLSDLQSNKADKATTLEDYGITDALSSDTLYAESSTVGGSAVSFETSIEESDKDLPIYFAAPSSTETAGIAAHNSDLSFNPSTGTLKVKKIEGTADRALADGDGNIISSVYLTKQEYQDYKERIEDIEGKIPAQASSSNLLADKAYVADQINAVSAYIDRIKNNIYSELPTPSEDYRGRTILLAEREVDTPYICLSVYGQYYWMELSGVGDTYTSILGSAVLGTMILGR